ncbi:MAG TPA: S8 family serine peptidase [Pyrinomonadaceae bacterium]|nr:S8 family serine peptidase [Pyrinomonadaceae bacterium]
MLLACLLSAGAATAGVSVRRGEGISLTDADGITLTDLSGVTATGSDDLLAYKVNGVTATGSDGVTATGSDGVTATGSDGLPYAGPNSLLARGVDTMSIASADGVTATGSDGITVTGSDGLRYRVDSLLIRRAEGVTATGSDGVTATGSDGVTATGSDGVTATGSDALSIVRAQGVTATGSDGLSVERAQGVTATGSDGRVFSIVPANVRVEGADAIFATGADGVTLSGIDGVTATGSDGVTATGSDGVTATGSDGVTATGSDALGRSGLQSLDPELAILLDRATDDSNINAAVVYHRQPTESDLADLRACGIAGGTLYRALPVVAVTATRRQLVAVSRLPNVRSIYGNRTLQTTSDPYVALAGAERVARDPELTGTNAGLPLTGRGVTVAVIDTGLDGTHADLAGRVARNVKLADTQSLGVGFTYPAGVEDVPNTDLTYGHGTFVAGVIAGDGARSGGAYAGVAPGAKVVGLSAGDLNLFHVLAGFDYVLTHPDLGVRVVNCSFSAETLYDENDPVNVATRILYERGVNVVFSAGNGGPGLHTLNPYAQAPWVVSVGATDNKGRLPSFSARGEFGGPGSRPTLVAPGVNVVGPRAAGVNLVGASALTSSRKLSAADSLYYTVGTGTSFSAPQVAGTIALMLEADPGLTPAEVRDILQRTATPLPPYYSHEVGAGMLNAHAAVLAATFPERLIGAWRATLDRGQVRFVNNPLQQFGGTAQPLSGYEAGLSIPEGALLASVQIAWGPIYSTNDLALALSDPGGVRRASSNELNVSGLTGRREGVVVKSPSPGSWRVGVTNTLGLAGTPQPFSGALEVTRAEYAPLSDLDGLSPSAREEVYQNIRCFVMWPLGDAFRPGFGVTRADLAAALVLGGRVPQYAPAQSNYSDVPDRTTTLFVESVQAAPGGALFPEAATGGRFGPDDTADRLTAAVALVRASGLRAEAERRAGALLTVTDAYTIPAALRGYVAVALERGLLTAEGGSFRPQSALTRLELAHAMSVFARRAAE